MNSFRRGKNYELLAKDLLSRLTSEDWRRLGGREVDKVTLSGDVCSLKPDSWYRQFSVEVKARKNLSIPDWYQKCKDDSKNRIPLLMIWESKYKRWLFIMDESLIWELEHLKGYVQERGE